MKDRDRQWRWHHAKSSTHYLDRPDGMTLQSIADEIGVTKACVKKIQDRALEKIRRALEVTS
jgi:DNA-directed RNA polymerase sigma subunit (sigma70/sigma32)